MSAKKSYVMSGDIVVEYHYNMDSNLDKNYKFVAYTSNSGKETTGYIKNIDLKEATKEETLREIERIEKLKEKTSSVDSDEENKAFLISHYQEIKNKNYYTAFHNYQYPKAKSVSDFAGWYKGVYEIDLSEIEKIGKNEYKYIVSIYSDSGLNRIETSIKVGKVDGKLKILGYGTKKLN